jgi:hypothetical protein
MLHRLILVTALAACGAKHAPIATPPGGTAGSGTLAGDVHFVGTPCAEAKSTPPCDGAYPDYEVVVYAADGKTVVGKARSGADGKFSLGLPEGKYVVLTPAGPPPAEPKRTEVTVSRDALSTIKLDIDQGVR